MNRNADQQTSIEIVIKYEIPQFGNIVYKTLTADLHLQWGDTLDTDCNSFIKITLVLPFSS